MIFDDFGIDFPASPSAFPGSKIGQHSSLFFKSESCTNTTPFPRKEQGRRHEAAAIEISILWQVPFKMVFGHNLHYMAPFGIPRTGFCMVFQHASLVVSCLEVDR